MTYEIYSTYGKMLHRTDDEAVARRGLRTYPLAWTLAVVDADGIGRRIIDINTNPSKEPGHDTKRV